METNVQLSTPHYSRNVLVQDQEDINLEGYELKKDNQHEEEEEKSRFKR